MNLSSGQKLFEGFSEQALGSSCNYFAQWTYNHPVIITQETNQKMHRIQKLLYKAIHYFVHNYDNYYHLMPVSERAHEIIGLCKQKPYRIGSYRTDFLIDKENNIKIIEITCRFALNGLFISGFFNLLTDRFLSDKHNIKKTDEYFRFFDYIIDYFGEFEHICFLKGKVEKNESKYAVSIFEKSGYKVHIIQADTIIENMEFLEKGVIISELNYEEWYNLPNDIIKKISDLNLINDLRTIFLIHDKRFFSVLNNPDFLNAAFTPNEMVEFLQYMVPTYMSNERPDIWKIAKNNKDKWIIKPCTQGRSINVYAGCTSSEEEWHKLFTDGHNTNMILQSYVDQCKFKGFVKDKYYEDYVVGILLLFNDNFFGPGVFRASSYPITNVVDDRKLSPLVTNDITDNINFNII